MTTNRSLKAVPSFIAASLYTAAVKRNRQSMTGGRRLIVSVCMRQRSRQLLLVLLVALVGLSSPSAAQSAGPDADDQRTTWDAMSEGERDVLLQMLQSPDWPFRVFGLLRLERYRGDEVQRLLGNALADDHWQVRCFALRQAQRMQVHVTPSDLASEDDPRVLRAALRHGVAIPARVVVPVARELMHSQMFDDILLGIELAASVDDQPLRRDAAQVIHRLITNMNDALAAYVGRRLSRVVGLARPLRSAEQWRDWLNSVRGQIELAAAPKTLDPLSGTTLVHAPATIAEMDSASFARLADYLAALRQRDLDVVIAMDSTASMLPMINEARAGVDSLIQFMSDVSGEMRFGFVAYRDHDNPPVCEHHPLSSDIGSIRRFLFNVRITGGADYPEAVLDGLERAARMEFNRDATRQVILVGDAPPHVRDGQRLLRVLEHFSEIGITVHAAHVPMERDPRFTAALTPDQALADKQFLEQYNDRTSTAFNEIASRTGGQFTTLRRAEQLVPAIMHFAIDQPWWPVFDEFYDLYLELCR